MTARPRGSLTPLLFGLVSVFWGSSFLFMKVAVDSFSAAQVMVIRLTLGALVLVSIMLITRRRWPRGARVWGSLLIISVFLCVIPFTLYAWASNYIPSGLTSIYNAATPVATLLLGLMILPQERANGYRLAGLALSAVGVVVLAAPWTFDLSTSDGTLLVLAQLAALGATVCYAIAFVLTRRLLTTGTYDATTIAATQISLAAIVGIIVSPFIGGLEPPTPTLPAVASLVALGVVSTGVVYIWHAKIIQDWGATAASTVTYVTPVVGVILGILVLNESLHWNEPVGGVLVLLGVLVGQLFPRPKPEISA